LCGELLSVDMMTRIASYLEVFRRSLHYGNGHQ
jgi:hypothetical protein